MERKILIFDSSFEGHHYYYLNLLLQSQNKNFTYYLHPELIKRIDVPNSKLKTIYAINEDDFEQNIIPTHNVKANVFKRIINNYRLWVVIKKLCDEKKINDIFFIELDSFIPFLTTLFYSKYKISGIYYQPYNFRKKLNAKEIFKKIAFKFTIRKRIIKKIFVLDEFFVIKEKFQSHKKIQYLPDPIHILNDSIDIEIEKIFSAPKFTYLFFGYIDKQKGILQLLDSLTMPNKELGNIRLILSGRIDPQIVEAVLTKIKITSSEFEIIVLNKFLSEAEVNTLITNSNALLAPYLNHIGSSGILNIAFGYNKPIISQNTNLIGDLILEYKIGIGINTFDSEEILQALIQLKNNKFSIDQLKSNEYINTHSEKDFIKVLTSSI